MLVQAVVLPATAFLGANVSNNTDRTVTPQDGNMVQQEDCFEIAELPTNPLAADPIRTRTDPTHAVQWALRFAGGPTARSNEMTLATRRAREATGRCSA